MRKILKAKANSVDHLYGYMSKIDKKYKDY